VLKSDGMIYTVWLIFNITSTS